jgi:hypothetical protein
LNGTVAFYYAIFEARGGDENYQLLINLLHINGEIAYFWTANLLLVLFSRLARIQK